jgi:heme-degrading monooxygenase HmoA
VTRERFAYIWQYTIDPDCRQAFLAAYEPQGEWARLFSRDAAYIETVLLQDDKREDRYMTIDYWTSRSDRDAFREQYSIEFEELDSRCEAFTREEQFIGDFQVIGVASGRQTARS